jgi:predicted nucleic acid-binding protein
MVFVDASALVKRYVRERHSTTLRRLLATGPVAISRLSEVEVPVALARLVREGRLSPRAGDRAIAALATDVAAWHVVEVTTTVTAMARQLLRRYDLRAGDAIQLASASWLRQAVPVISLAAFDARLVAAAAAERFATSISTRQPRAARR